MTPQDFKALLDALQGIQRAIEGKVGSSPEKAVNRFAEVYRMLQEAQKIDNLEEMDNLHRGCALDKHWCGEAFVEGYAEATKKHKKRFLEIQKKYAKIAEKVLNEKN